jgi:hypothetical protein
MQPQNVKEYETIRAELKALKECITAYVGFVIAGSATAFYGLAEQMTKPDARPLGIAASSLILAIVSTLVLMLLNYKFNSHNRYVGYSKLLMHERYTMDDVPVFGWEICVDRLRHSDRNDEALLNYCHDPNNKVIGVEDLHAKIQKLSGQAPPDNSQSVSWGGFRSSVSWRFPFHVANVFLCLNVVFVAFALYFLPIRGLVEQPGSFGPRDYVLLIAVALLLCVLIGLWRTVRNSLFKLMLGSETVEAYCWKFVPIRARFLRCLKAEQYELIWVADESSAGRF